MEAWVIALVTAGATTAVTTIVGLIITHLFKKQIKNKEERDAELFRLRENEIREQRKKDTESVVKLVVKPIEEKIDRIDNKLEKVEDGTLSTLRNDILTCYYKCVDKGYRNDYDYQNIHHMYDSYKELNGNSYVADVIKRFDETILTKEEYEKKHKQKKQKLNETKSKGEK